MQNLVRLFIVSVLIGFTISAVFTAVLLIFDIAGLRHLLLDTGHAVLATTMIFAFSGTLFGGVQFALAVTALADAEDRRGPFNKE